MSNESGHQDKINAMGVRLNVPSTHGDEATGIYVNLKKDIVYFTNHDFFDKTWNQHFPMSNAHADLKDRLIYEPQFCQPCSDLLFPVNDALRLLFGDVDIRKELRNIGFSFDIPVKRHHFCWGGKKVKGEHYEMGKHMAPTPQRLPPKSPSLRVPRHMSEVNVLKRTKNVFIKKELIRKMGGNI
ncbi:hypothetical protein BPOR_0307g00040 [Botrytis porri]|uniref:Uncharacterized protein n=1 Tax=Botrytis porri TaxID=87229 RepID=A0A4Z1KSV0_9HELO|nr:hypothetical protein BPOR_0307g00040 [Botrytis porri]